MIITYHGGQCVKIVYGDTTIAINPGSKSTKISSSFGADIALSSANIEETNGFDSVTRGDKEPFKISGPGEYEVKDVMIKGVGVTSSKDGKEFMNTAYSFMIDSINCLVLGPINEPIPTEKRENLGTPDIVFLTISNMKISDAYKHAVSYDPSIIIPLDYEADKNLLAQFLKEAGQNPKAEEKLVYKKKDLDGKEAEVAILEKV
jgi:hypothetical protein